MTALYSHNKLSQTVNKRNTLTLNFSVNGGSRTLLPEIDMDVADYDVTGTGPDGASFEISTSDGFVEVPGLAFGEWTVVVQANDADSTVIGRGEGTTTVHIGENSTLNITVTPLDGYGTLDLTLLWNAEDTDIPSIEAELIPSSGPAVDLDFTITGGNTGTFTSGIIPTGYHTLTLKLLDNGILTMGAVEVVRIVKDQTTSGTFEFYDINEPGGNIDINITPEMADPIDVTITGQLGEIEQGSTMTITASVPVGTGNVVYVWYINGESIDTGESYEAGSGLSVGVYRLDVTAFTVDGLRAGSISTQIEVLPENNVPQYPPSNIDAPNVFGSSGNKKAFLRFGVYGIPTGEIVIGYRIYRGIESDSIEFYRDISPTSSYVTGSNSSYFTDLDLVNDTKYKYQTAVITSTGLSEKSNVIEATPNFIQSPNFNRIWGISDEEIYVVGEKGVVWRYNGTDWNYKEVGTGGNLSGLHGSSNSNIWVTGEMGVCALFDGNTWNADFKTPYGQFMYDVFVADSNFAVAGHSGGYFYIFNGVEWNYSSVGGPQKTGVGGFSRNSIWGTDEVLGWITHWNGSSWDINYDPLGDGENTGRYGVVVPNDNSVTIVGKNGSIISNNGTGWFSEDSPTTETLYEIDYRDDFGYYGVGANGLIVHKMSSGQWTLISSGTTENLTGIWISPSGIVWVCGANGTLFSLSG